MSTGRSIYKYRFKCMTEDLSVYIWSETPPTMCCNDASHVIDLDSITILDQISQNAISIIQSDGVTGENYRVESRIFDCIPSGTTVMKISWPLDISILTVNLASTVDNNNDVINGYVGNNTIIGYITQDVNIGDKVINVSQTVVENMSKGYIMKLTDGVNQSVLDRCLDKNLTSVTCETGSDRFYPGGSYVQMTVQNMKDFNIISNGSYNIQLAAKSIKASFIQANVEMELHYTNMTNVQKTFSVWYEYFY